MQWPWAFEGKMNSSMPVGSTYACMYLGSCKEDEWDGGGAPTLSRRHAVLHEFLCFYIRPIDVLIFRNVLNYPKQPTRIPVVRLLSSSALRVFLCRVVNRRIEGKNDDSDHSHSGWQARSAVFGSDERRLRFLGFDLAHATDLEQVDNR